MDERKPIGRVTATVQFYLYEGDKYDRESWDWFEFSEPGIHPSGELGVCTRKCTTLKAEVELAKETV